MDGGTATSRNEDQVLETLREEFFPTGILSETAARELLAQYAPHGRVATAAGIETLLRVIEAAIQTPSLLSAFLIGQLCAAVIAGEGPALGRRPHFSRAIDAEDVRFLRRVLEAAGGTAGMPVSRAEAEALFDLHDAAAAGSSDSSFHDLFCKAIANHLIAASGHAVPPTARGARGRAGPGVGRDRRRGSGVARQPYHARRPADRRGAAAPGAAR